MLVYPPKLTNGAQNGAADIQSCPGCPAVVFSRTRCASEGLFVSLIKSRISLNLLVFKTTSHYFRFCSRFRFWIYS